MPSLSSPAQAVADRAHLSMGAEFYSIPPRAFLTAVNRHCCEAEPPAGASAERDSGLNRGANGSEVGNLGASHDSRAKLSPCGGISHDPARAQTIAALGAQARDDLSNQQTHLNSVLHDALNTDGGQDHHA